MTPSWHQTAKVQSLSRGRAKPETVFADPRRSWFRVSSADGCEADPAQSREGYNEHPDHVRFAQERWLSEVSDFLELDHAAR